MVGPAGGSLTASDGTSLTIPAGALASSVTISMTPVPGGAAPGGVTLVGTPYLLGPEGQQFASPVTVLMTFNPALLPAGVSSSQILIFTAPAGSSAFAALPTSLVDQTHVSALTTHFSIFEPGVAVAPGGTSGSAVSSSTGGTTGSLPDGGASGSTGGTAISAGVAGTTGELATAVGGETSGGSSGGSSSGGGTTGSGDGGAAGCSPDQGCVGLSGCMALTITSAPTTNTCDDGFLDPTSTTAEIALGGFHTPEAQASAPSIDFSLGEWTAQLDLPCCPASSGSMAVKAYFDWSGGLNCPGVPTAEGTVDFELADGGLSGTLSLSDGPFGASGGGSASFSFPDTEAPGFCDAGVAAAPPGYDSDAGLAGCSATLDCLGPDAGGLVGPGTFWLDPTGSSSGSWCNGPLLGVPSSATLSVAPLSAGANAGLPMLTIDYDDSISGLPGDGLWQLQAFLPCCPAGPGGETSDGIDVYSLCGGTGPQQVSVASGSGTVFFTQTDGGLAGTILLQGAKIAADATFALP